MILNRMTRDREIARQEVFGPVLSFIVYDIFDEALSIANDTAFGLSSCRILNAPILLSVLLQKATVACCASMQVVFWKIICRLSELRTAPYAWCIKRAFDNAILRNRTCRLPSSDGLTPSNWGALND